MIIFYEWLSQRLLYHIGNSIGGFIFDYLPSVLICSKTGLLSLYYIITRKRPTFEQMGTDVKNIILLLELYSSMYSIVMSL